MTPERKAEIKEVLKHEVFSLLASINNLTDTGIVLSKEKEYTLIVSEIIEAVGICNGAIVTLGRATARLIEE